MKAKSNLKVVQPSASVETKTAAEIETADSRRRQRKEDITVRAAVELIIDGVDLYWPSAIQTEFFPLTSAKEHCYELEEFFRKAREREDDSLLSDVVYKVLDSMAPGDDTHNRLESALIRHKYSLEHFFTAIGFAAGLRSAGTPTSAARQMMLGLLRNFDLSEAPAARKD